MNTSKVCVSILIGGYFLYCATNLDSWHFIDNVDLVIHEAGHTMSFFFGQFLRILGGSLSQILTPLVFAGYFYGRGDYFASNILMCWVGYNLVNVSIYIGDAIDMNLPLLGGEGVIHDWNYILNATGMLDKTYQFASLAHGIGFSLIAICTVAAIYYSRRNEYL